MVRIETRCRISLRRAFGRIPWRVIPEPPATLQIQCQSQSHVGLSHCRVLPLGEFTVMIPEPHATLQGAVTWRNQCPDCATLQGVIIPSAILKIVFRYILFFLVFSAVWALISNGFRIVSDTLVWQCDASLNLVRSLLVLNAS